MLFQPKITDPSVVVGAFVRANNNLGEASKILGVHPTTLRATVKRMELAGAIREAVIALFGQYGPGGKLRDPRLIEAALAAEGGDRGGASVRLGVSEDHLVASLSYHELVRVERTVDADRVAPRRVATQKPREWTTTRSPNASTKAVTNDLGAPGMRALPLVGYELVAWDGWTCFSTASGKVGRRNDTTRRRLVPVMTTPVEQEGSCGALWPSAVEADGMLLVDFLRTTSCPTDSIVAPELVVPGLRPLLRDAVDEVVPGPKASRARKRREAVVEEAVSEVTVESRAEPDREADRKRRRSSRARGAHRIDVDSTLYGELEAEAVRLSKTPEEVLLMAFALAKGDL